MFKSDAFQALYSMVGSRPYTQTLDNSEAVFLVMCDPSMNKL
jgi:hypothetical protein